MRLSVDQGRCEGYGLCVEAAPDLLHLDEDGELVLDVEQVPPASLAAAETAVRVCPVAALRVG